MPNGCSRLVCRPSFMCFRVPRTGSIQSGTLPSPDCLITTPTTGFGGSCGSCLGLNASHHLPPIARLRVAISEVQLRAPLTIAGASVDLMAPADFCCSNPCEELVRFRVWEPVTRHLLTESSGT